MSMRDVIAEARSKAVAIGEKIKKATALENVTVSELSLILAKGADGLDWAPRNPHARVFGVKAEATGGKMETVRDVIAAARRESQERLKRQNDDAQSDEARRQAQERIPDVTATKNRGLGKGGPADATASPEALRNHIAAARANPGAAMTQNDDQIYAHDQSLRSAIVAAREAARSQS